MSLRLCKLSCCCCKILPFHIKSACVIFIIAFKVGDLKIGGITMQRLLIAVLILVLMLTSASCKGTTGIGTDNPVLPDTSQSASAPPVSPSATETFAETPGNNNVIMLEGTIGDIPVHMSLYISGGIVTGSYYYDKVGKELKLKGTTAEADRMIYLDEYDENGELTGKFDGWYTHSIRMTGSWTNSKTDKTLNFNLKVIGGIPANAIWAGEWKRMDTGRFGSATLVVFNETKSGFEFQMDAFSGAHMGFINGTAVIDGTTAYFKDKDTTAALVFSMKNDLIDVVSKGEIYYYAGANVVFDGSYTQKKLPEDTLLNMGYVPDEARDVAMHAMTGEDYELFLNTAQIRGDREDIDGLGAEVFNWWVNGFAGSNESIVMFLPDGKLCAAVIDPERNAFKVYTNAEYITAIPETIWSWIADLQELLGLTSDLPVQFHNTDKN